jgi:flagellar basal-body rod protein FlgF
MAPPLHNDQVKTEAFSWLRRQDMDIGWNMAAYMGVRASRELEVVSHNLANASTLGFKRELLNNWQLNPPQDILSDQPEAAQYVDVRSHDLGQGSIHETGKDTDLALQGPGFFKIQTPQGIRYTRNGNFRLSPDYQLVTQEGYTVLGKNGPITLNSLDKDFTFDAEGGIHMDKNLSDQILVVDFANPQDLRPWGQTFLIPGPQAGFEQETPTTRILQGNIEESNVDLVAESINLIDIQRRYEAYLKVLDTFTTSDRKVVDEIGQQA